MKELDRCITALADVGARLERVNARLDALAGNPDERPTHRPDPDMLLDIPAELEAFRRKYEATGGDVTLEETARYIRLAGKLQSYECYREAIR